MQFPSTWWQQRGTIIDGFIPWPKSPQTPPSARKPSEKETYISNLVISPTTDITRIRVNSSAPENVTTHRHIVGVGEVYNGEHELAHPTKSVKTCDTFQPLNSTTHRHIVGVGEVYNGEHELAHPTTSVKTCDTFQPLNSTTHRHHCWCRRSLQWGARTCPPNNKC